MRHIINGHEINIYWEQKELIERHDSGCTVWAMEGEGDNGVTYTGVGDIQHGELEDVNEIEEHEQF